MSEKEKIPDIPAQVRDETSELRLLFEVSQALEASSELTDQLDAALGLMARYTGMMRGTLALLTPDGREIEVEASFGLKPHQLERARYKLGEGVTGRVIETGTPVVVPNVSKEPLFLNKTGARDLAKEDISFICVPIKIGGETIGALSADRLFDDTVRLEEDARLLQVLASLIARAVRVRREFNQKHKAVIEENRRLQALVQQRFHPGPIIAGASSMRRIFAELAQVAPSGATVLIRGESGTGKELIAATIHANSPRAGHPFIKVNCAALPEGLIESELFGHEKGAFTGAQDVRKGRFEMANGGTLFLDEVGDMTPLTQAKLLRVLQEKEFERLGGAKTIRVDLRLIAATNRNLEKMVEDGEFREDLYYRLSVFPLHLPPLRERRSDIMELAVNFMQKFAKENQRQVFRISGEAAARLRAYHWPGNIRELENAMERAVLLCEPEGVIRASNLPLWVQNLPEPSQDESSCQASGNLQEKLDKLEKEIIAQALSETGGNGSKAAEKLGISERIMGLRMKKYALDFREFRK